MTMMPELLDEEFQTWTPEDFVYFGRKALLKAIRNYRRYTAMNREEQLARSMKTSDYDTGSKETPVRQLSDSCHTHAVK